jgi:hypothetical protein
MQWTIHLLEKIERQRRYAEPYEKRYRNQFVLPFIEREYREVYGSQVDLLRPILDAPRTGTAAIGIDALVERLTLNGVIARDEADAEAAAVIWRAWEDNDLDVMHREAHREALIKARSFGSVHRSADNRAVVGIESAEQMAVHRTPGPPYDVDAALKVDIDEWTGKQVAQLRLPGRDLRMVDTGVPSLDPEGSGVSSTWAVAQDGETATRLPAVPVAEFASRDRLLTAPSSEIEPIATSVDICDLVEGLMVFAGHFGAVPIRYGTGLTVPRDPADPTKALLGPDGKPMLAFKPRADQFWGDTNPEARFGQLTPAELAGFIAWAEHASSRVRAQTSVASTYYSIDLKSHMSAELLKTDEAPMVRRILSMGRDGTLNGSWRRIHRFMLWIERPASRARLRPRWADPNTRVEAAAVDSFQKAVASGLGVRVAAEQFLGWDPELVDRAVAEAEEARAAIAELGDPALERVTRQLTNMTAVDAGA